MSIVVVWLDQEHAKLFQFSEERMERKNIDSVHTDHHTHRREQIDRQRDEQHLFAGIAKNLEHATQILLLGPGVAKNQFMHYLTEKSPPAAKRVVACETVDHPSDAQIAAYAKKFFGTAIS